jgi:hypothetical protein
MSFGEKICNGRPGIRPVRCSGFAAVIVSVLAAGLVACGSGSSSSSQPTARAAATDAASAAPVAASSGSASAAADGLTPDGTKLKFGQTAKVGYSYGTAATTGPYELTVTVKKGSISDLSDFDLDAQTKLGVPFYVTEVVKNVGTAAGKVSGWGGALTVKNVAGDEIDSITLLGDFPTCQGNPPDTLAPGKQFTECDVYIAPRGQSVASVAYQNYDNTTLDQTTVTWTP